MIRPACRSRSGIRDLGVSRRLFFVASVVSLFASASILAEAGPPSGAVESCQRPRIGLVLSGGSARGAAHVGVLKALEEMRIPIDVVAGTSMGSIVGGLYAAGTSPAEMEELLVGTDWRDLLDDKPPRRHLPYRRKVDDQTYLTRLEVGFNGGSFSIPPGLISGQKVGFALLVMALQTTGIEDFDDLPIPFRAVATDLETGGMVVLSRGNLARAMRASMSLPGIFSPIEIDGRLLVDGGLVRNLPVDVAREMGADVVIAVDVGQPLPGKEGLASLAKVTAQMIGLQIQQNVETSSEEADVLIRPALEGFGSAQFERGPEMVPQGELAAREIASELGKFSVAEEQYQAWRSKLRRRRSFEGAKVRSIQINSTAATDSDLTLRQVRSRPGDDLDLEVIRLDLQRLYETGDYERVDASLAEVDGDFDLTFETIDKSWGPTYLRFGLNLFADLEGESSFDVLASTTMTRLNRLRGEIKIQAQVGENPQIFGSYYQPLNLDQNWFADLSFHQTRVTELVPTGDGAGVPTRADVVGVGADLGLQMGRYGEVRLGLSHLDIVTKPRSLGTSEDATDIAPRSESTRAGIRLTVTVDQFDNMNFPRHGYFGFAGLFSSREALGSDQSYDSMVAFLGVAATRGRSTLLGLSNFFSALGTASPETSGLGGLFRLSGYPRNSVTGRYGGNLSLLYLYRYRNLPTGLGEGLYIGGSIEAGNLWHEASQASFSDLRYAASIFLGADTVLGPMYLAQGLTEDGEGALYFFMGRTF